MIIKEEIRKKSEFDIEELIGRLKKDFGIKNKGSDLVEDALYDTQNIILNKTNRNKVPSRLASVWYRMTKDYWYLGGFDKLLKIENDRNINEPQNLKVKSIAVGDTKTTFVDTTAQININGTTYNTGTIDFSEDALIEKYKRELYTCRKMRW